MTKLAYVGMPCDIEALRKVDAFSKDIEQAWSGDAVLKIGLFCRENWAYTCFRALIEDDYGIKLENVVKFDIKKGNIIAYLEDGGRFEFPLGEAKPYVRTSCQVCLDFTAELADISIGAVGTPRKWSTVIVRSPKGLEVVEGAVKEGYIEIKPIEDVKPGTGLIKKIIEEKRTENLAEAREREKAGVIVHHIKTLGEEDLNKIREGAKGKDFTALDHEIIDTGLCIACGTCEAVCPEGCIEVIEEKPELKGKCKEDCYACYLCCPRTSLPMKALEGLAFGKDTPFEDGIGKYLKIYAARATHKETLERGQDGGAVTAILAYSLDRGIVDSAVSVKSGDAPWRPISLKYGRGERIQTSGTIYSHSTSIPIIKG
jgi:coenzyme F420 hydrogenase subunit beta